MSDRDSQVCRLCLQPNPLSRSHIIPEFLYRKAHGDDNSTYAVDRRKMKGRFIQKGLHERLFCAECEQNRLNRPYEDYFEKIWYKSSPLPQFILGKSVSTESLDYRRFKLFHLSILWRTSIASDFAFRQTRLGPFEERLRAMILAGDPGERWDFPIWGNVLISLPEAEVRHDVLTSPVAQRLDGSRKYSAVYAGCEWSFFVSKNAPPQEIQPFCLNTNGSIVLPVKDILSCEPARNLFDQYFRTARRLGRPTNPWLTRSR